MESPFLVENFPGGGFGSNSAGSSHHTSAWVGTCQRNNYNINDDNDNNDDNDDNDNDNNNSNDNNNDNDNDDDKNDNDNDITSPPRWAP